MDSQIQLREKQAELIAIIEALAELSKSPAWKTLVELVFNKSLASLERQLLNEALEMDVKTTKLYRLQGEWVWAKQYCDITKFAEQLKKQLAEIKRKLNE